MVRITTPYVTLGQVLKMLDYISSGGEAKHAVKVLDIEVNGEAENRRGRKLYPGDEVVIEGNHHTIQK